MKEVNSKRMNMKMYFDICLNEVLEYTTGNGMINVTVLHVYQTQT